MSAVADRSAAAETPRANDAFAQSLARAVHAGQLDEARRLLGECEARWGGRRRPRRCSTGLRSLDAALGGGLPRGALGQIVAAAPGVGTLSLALHLARATAGPNHPLFLIDPDARAYPPAIATLGIDLSQLILLRPAHAVRACWAMEQSLRCSAVGAVVGWFDPPGHNLRTARRADAAAWRRLQLAAEAGGGVGLIVQRAADPALGSFAAWRIDVHAMTLENDGSCRWRLNVRRAGRAADEGRSVDTGGEAPATPIAGSDAAASAAKAPRAAAAG